jgi:hypothetical protein
MTTIRRPTRIGPHDPEVETVDAYRQRVIDTAGEPSPEQYSRLAALLGITSRREEPSVFAGESNAEGGTS